jgi:hypothetical protein
VHPVPTLPHSGRRLLANHLQQHRRVLFHHAVRVGRVVLPLHSPQHGSSDHSTDLGARHLHHNLRVFDRCAVLCGPGRGGYGPAHHSGGHTVLLLGRSVGEAKVVLELLEWVHVFLSEGFLVGQGRRGWGVRF